MAPERGLLVLLRTQKANLNDQTSDLFSRSGSTSRLCSGCDTRRRNSKLAYRATSSHLDLELCAATSDLTQEGKVVSMARKDRRFSGSMLFGT